MPSQIRVLIADDHDLVRKGLQQLFNLSDDIRCAGEAVDGTQVMALLHRVQYDLILLDLNMPGPSGPDLIARLRDLGAPPILVLSMHDEPPIVRRALAAGAAGYLTKSVDPELLLRAIRKLVSGQRFLDPALAEAMAFEISEPSVKCRHEVLSAREMEVFLLLVQGFSINDIAEHLRISNKTVSTHKARLMEKMAFASNVDIVKYAVRHRLAA